MRGANGSTAGARGLVPKPAAADNVKYLKGDGSWSAVTNASAATNAEAAAATSTTTFVTPANAGLAIAAQRNGLAPAQGLVFNGTGRATATLSTAAGTLDYTFRAKINVAALTAAHQTAYTLGPANAMLVRPTTGYILDEGGVYSVGVVAGITSDVAIVRTGGVSYLYINGLLKDQHANTYDFSNSTVNIGAANANADSLTGVLSDHLIYNRALSAAEVLALYQSSAPAAADYDRTSQIGTNYWSSAGSWTGFASTATTISGTANDSSAATFYQAASFVRGSWGAGLKWGLSGTASTLANPVNVYYFTGSTYVLIGTISATGAFDFTFTGPTVAGSDGNIYIQATAAGAISLSGLTVTRFGLRLAPDANNAGAGLEWLDVSGNRAHIILPTSGVSWSLPSSQQIVIEASTATNGNQQLGGASLIDANKQWRIQSWTVNCSTGTPTISLGNVSAGTQYVSGAVMAAGNNDITLLARFPSTANLWANSNTTATLIHRIVLVPAT